MSSDDEYEPATADDPHPGELYRYSPANMGWDREMVMYRGGETWLRMRGEGWRLLKPWRPQP